VYGGSAGTYSPSQSSAQGYIVTANYGGGFLAAAPAATGRNPTSVAVADFNGDGKADLAVANGDSNTVSILLGNGDGTFSPAAAPVTALSPNSVAVGDFNGDGKADLAVANINSSTLTILLGNGNGRHCQLGQITERLLP
jgi:hypothetical protein